MKRLHRLFPVSLGIATLVGGALLVAACKQGEGERCQVEADCEDGLVCAQATQTCQETTGGGIDALPPIDGTADAPPDAPPDAAPDAPDAN